MSGSFRKLGSSVEESWAEGRFDQKYKPKLGTAGLGPADWEQDPRREAQGTVAMRPMEQSRTSGEMPLYSEEQCGSSASLKSAGAGYHASPGT